MPYPIIIGRTEKERKDLGDKGLAYIGKSYVQMGNTSSLSNYILLDIAKPHTILVSGKKGCLSGDTKIFTNHGFKDIKDFDEGYDKILSFNKEKKDFEWENARLLRYPNKDEKLVEIEFKDGHNIKMTEEHPLLLEYGKYLFWKEPKNIKENDKIVSVI